MTYAKTLAERLNDIAHASRHEWRYADVVCVNEAADLIEQQAAEIETLRRSNAAAKVVIERQDQRAARIGAEYGVVKQRANDVEGERAANALLTNEIERLTAELELRRKSGSAFERLHNLCEGIANDADGSEWSREEWEKLDAEMLELKKANKRLTLLLAASPQEAPPALLLEDTVPWPTVTRYSGGASHEGIGGRVWIRLSDEGSEVEYVPAQPAPEPLSEERVFNNNELMHLNGSLLQLALPQLMLLVRAIERAHGITKAE